jgi:hypothetical protein
MKINKFKFILLGAALLGLTMAGCNSDDVLTAPRLFRPIATETISSNTISLTWNTINDDASAYQIELSIDSFATTYKSVDTTEKTYTFSNLTWDNTYQIRIKAITSASNISSSEYYVCDDAKITYPTKLNKITNVTDVAAQVTWSTDKSYTNLVISKKNSGENTYTPIDTVSVSSTESAALSKIVKNLSPETNYKVTAYTTDADTLTYAGYQTFKTEASEDYGTNTVDLRNLTDSQAKDTINDTFLSSLTSGAVIVLNGGTIYKIDNAVAISKSITFVTGLSLSGNANLEMNGCTFVGSTDADIAFKNVDITTAGDKSSSNFGGKYAFNNSVSATVNSLSFTGCKIKYLRGIIRLQGAASTINNLTITNCVMDSIGGYGIANCDVTGSAFGTTTITNSTVAHAEKTLVNSKSATGFGDVTITNCTFAYCGNGTNYILDFGSSATVNTALNLKVSSCIFGGCFLTPTSSTATINGFRCSGSGATTSFVDNYKTSDLIWTTNITTGEDNAPIPGIISYGKATTDLWEAPLTSDFKVIDKTSDIYKYNIGDSRWY